MKLNRGTHRKTWDEMITACWINGETKEFEKRITKLSKKRLIQYVLYINKGSWDTERGSHNGEVLLSIYKAIK